MVKERVQSSGVNDPILEVAQQACQLIAPVWPLDKFIAVNPWWSHTHQAIDDCVATLASRGKVAGLMPARYYQSQWDKGVITDDHLRFASQALTGETMESQQLLEQLKDDPQGHKTPLMTDTIDQQRDLKHLMPWQEEVTHQISQFCGAFFDHGQASWKPHKNETLYSSWLHTLKGDKGIGLLMSEPTIYRTFATLPDTPDAVINDALSELGVPQSDQLAYCHSLLLSVKGWAAWCAYLGWQANLNGGDDDHTLQLLCIRLAWELILHRHYNDEQAKQRFLRSLSQDTWRCHAMREQQQGLWIWQRALEYAFQSSMNNKLMQARSCESKSATPPKVQAAFCIDVRSEVYRRHLEAQSAAIQTIGFAGFFGMPINYKPNETQYVRPQLPGLLAPQFTVGHTTMRSDENHQRLSQSWRQFKKGAPSAFTFVESAGLFYAYKLLKKTLFPNKGDNHPINGCTQVSPPQLLHRCDNHAELTLEDKLDLAHGVLIGLGLSDTFAPIILLVGHGSQSHNNPHAAGLDCGACCGQTGEVNSRALAHLLNEPEVRVGLTDKGWPIPEETCFVPALHNTTTDAITLFDQQHYPQLDHSLITAIEQWLDKASQEARQERMHKFDHKVTHSKGNTLLARSHDWSQVRPEWGLVNNACFIIAPRSRTAHLNLEGRSFLHDYNADQDQDKSLLELILTAPMLVTHWINFQYYTSVVDNRNYGSGNKVLHNVVGGNIGVFEGNGGDLRTGLALQSLHDGKQWMHQPLRLSVYVEAPQDAIDNILHKHAHVKQLIDNQWLYLFQIGESIYQRTHHGWQPQTTTHNNL